MAENNNGGQGAGNPDNNGNGNGQGSGNGAGNGNGQGNQDPTIPKHRFDEVNKEAQELRAWKEQREKADKEAEERRLTEGKKFEELAQKHKDEAEKARQETRTLRTQSAIERAAFKAGITDTDAAIKLIDMSKVTVKDDGTIEGIDTAVQELLKARPYLKQGGGAQPPAHMGGGSNPDNGGGEQTYALSWVRKMWADVAWTRTKHAEYGNITGAEFLEKIEREKKIDRTK